MMWWRVEAGRLTGAGRWRRYSIGIALDLKNHVLYSNRSAAHAHMRRFGKAKDNAAECVEISPDWWKGYVRLGQVRGGCQWWCLRAADGGLV